MKTNNKQSKEEIERIIRKLRTRGWTDANEVDRYFKDSLNKIRALIIQEIKEKLPKEKRYGENNQGWWGDVRGYNEAIKEIKQILESL